MRTSFMKYAVAGAAALSLVAGGAVVAQAALTKNPAEVTAGTYDLESSHGKITWSVNHFGLSTYTGQFVNVKAVLKLDPANPSASTLTATVPLTDVAPNRPTRHQLNNTPGLDYMRSFSVGGAAIEGEVITADGQTRPVHYDWYSHDIRDARFQGTWQDADRAFMRFSRQLADGRL